jgi:hypothetical protein
MKTVELNSDNARWSKLLAELQVPNLGDLVIRAVKHYHDSEDADLEPTDGPIALLVTGAVLYWSDSQGVYILSGYAHDGRDVDPYLYPDADL